MRLGSVKGELLDHSGYKEGVMMTTPHNLDIKIGSEVTDAKRTILSVKQSAYHGAMTVFAPDYAGPKSSKIVTDKDSISKIMDILKATRGVTIECEDNSYVIDAAVVPKHEAAEWFSPHALVATQLRKTNEPNTQPSSDVISTQHLNRALSQMEKTMVADDAIEKLHNSERAEAELSRQIKVKSPTTPHVPTQKEREDHNTTHCPYRNWCSHCVAGKAPDPDHQ